MTRIASVLGCLLTVLSVIALASSADAWTLCAKKDRRTNAYKEGSPVKLRNVCRTNEIAIDPAELGLQGPKGDTGDRGPAGPKGDTGDQGPQGDAGQDSEVWPCVSVNGNRGQAEAKPEPSQSQAKAKHRG